MNEAETFFEESGSGPPIILSPVGIQGVASSYQAVVGAWSQEHRVWCATGASAALPSPDVIAEEVLEDLRAALKQFEEISGDRAGEPSGKMLGL